ncbi:MAG: nicotinate (nicotinamide) nucleotide adenylyltransferase [Burkholderiales bacterium]|nr:nicotinate (nicotinamide) nucleotide adenylyltransferase [Burkholderiales bacterium]
MDHALTAATRTAGLFGGSFDPPHLAHRALAEGALAQLALDELVWVPAQRSPHKAGQAPAPGADRVAMLRLLSAGEPRFSIDSRELERTGPSYTVDTLRELHAERPGTRWWLVIGQDQYARFDTWHEWREILALAGLAVAARDGQTVRAAPGLAGIPYALRIVEMPALPHSATTVRARAAAGLDVTALVGTPVARYIADHHLYRIAQA